MGVTDTQSYSLVIRDVFHDALARDPFFACYTKRKTKMLTVQPDILPFLGVYIMDETMLPDGDLNAGFYDFIHTLRIGFSAIIANNDQAVAEAQIDAAFWRIMHVLWTDPYIINVISTYNPTLGSGNPDNTRFEGISRGVRRHVFGTTQSNNETPLAELQYDVSVQYRSMWMPTIVDDLNEVDLRTGIKIGETKEQMDQRQQFNLNMKFDNAAQKAKPKQEEHNDG
jgi:hypothetical protein